MNSSNHIIKKDLLIQIVSIIIICILCLININKLNYIAVLNDEFGYWGNAISLLGYDWKDLIAETPYYSMGYSLCLLPIILLFETPLIWYKASIVLNIILLLGAYILCCKTGRKLFSNVPKEIINFVSLLVILYPSNICYAQVAWSESLQYFLVWVITYIIVKLENSFSYHNFIGINLLFVYLYFVHIRNIGVIIIGVFCLSLVLIKHKKNILYFLIPIILVIGGYFCVDFIKDYQLSNLWNNSNMSGINNISLGTNTVSNYLNLLTNQMRLFIESLGGKLICLLFSSGLIFGIAIQGFFGETIKNIKLKHLFCNHYISKLWCVCTALGMWVITSLQMLEWPVRKDIIVNSRYIEQALGPILLLGFLYVICNFSYIKYTAVFSEIVIILGIRSVFLRVNGASGEFNSICSPIIGAFYDNIQDAKTVFIYIVFISLLIFLTIFLTGYIEKKQIRHRLVCIVFLIFFIVIGYKSSTYMNRARFYFESNTVPIYEAIKSYDEKSIYYIKSTDYDLYSVNPKYLQFLIPEKTIHVIDKKELWRVDRENIFVLVNPKNSQMIGYINNVNGAKKVAETEQLIIYWFE